MKQKFKNWSELKTYKNRSGKTIFSPNTTSKPRRMLNILEKFIKILLPHFARSSHIKILRLTLVWSQVTLLSRRTWAYFPQKKITSLSELSINAEITERKQLPSRSQSSRASLSLIFRTLSRSRKTKMSFIIMLWGEGARRRKHDKNYTKRVALEVP